MFVGISPTSRDEGAPPIVHPTMRTTLPNLRVLGGRRSAAPDARVIRDASGPRRRAVTLANCPRTYASMITHVDSLGRPVDPAPPGWVDPFILTVTRIEPWTRDVVVVTADLEQGTGGRQYRCGVRRAGAVWRADCVAGRSILH